MQLMGAGDPDTQHKGQPCLIIQTLPGAMGVPTNFPIWIWNTIFLTSSGPVLGTSSFPCLRAATTLGDATLAVQPPVHISPTLPPGEWVVGGLATRSLAFSPRLCGLDLGPNLSMAQLAGDSLWL